MPEATTKALVASSAPAVDTDLILDIFAIYTNEALAQLGGSVAAMKAMIYAANDASNTVLANSQVALRFRVVGFAKVADTFVEPAYNGVTSPFDLLINWVTNPSDGKMDEAQTYRNQYGADEVILVASAAAFLGTTCGVGWVNPGFSDRYSYVVYSVSCLNSITYTHEIGHTFGCQHDRYSEASYVANNPTFYGYGDCWEDASRSDCTCYASVMVYVCDTPTKHCTQCRKKQYLSNPNVIDSGNPTGRANAACGLQMHNNRFLPIAYRKSIQPGGILYSVSRPSAIYSTCYTVTITGWQLLRNQTDYPTVTLDGKPTVILSYNVNSIVVRTIAVSGPSTSAGNVVVSTASGRVTTLYSAFTFVSSYSKYAETFTAGSLSSTRWFSAGLVPWVVNSGGVYKDGSNSPADTAPAILQYNASNSNAGSGSCTEKILSLSFSYWAYSNYPFCYGYLLAQSRAVASQSWKTLWSRKGQSTGGPTPYINVTYSFAENIASVRIVANTQSNTNCRYFSPMSITNLVVVSSSSCSSVQSCSSSSVSAVQGTIYSVSPSVVFSNTCYLVTISGSKLSQVGSDEVASVSLGGVPALSIVSSSDSKVVVLSPTAPSRSSDFGDVVVTTSKGRQTVLPSSFSFVPFAQKSAYLETFHSGSFDTVLRWTSTGSLPLSFANYQGNEYLRIDPSVAADESPYAEITFNTSPSSEATGYCTESLTSLSFKYNAYSSATFCYGTFTASIISAGSTSWTSIWTMSNPGTLASGVDPNTLPWTTVGVNLNNAVAVKLTKTTAQNTNCRYFSTIFLDNLSLNLTTNCNPTTVCKSSSQTNSPSPLPTTINPSRAPTRSPSFVISNQPSFAPSICPTVVPSTTPTSVPTRCPSISITGVPSLRPSPCPSISYTVKPSTALPSTAPTFRPSAFPTSNPSMIPTRTPTILPSLVPSRLPSVRPSTKPTNAPTIAPSRKPSTKSTAIPTSLKPTRIPSFKPSCIPTSPKPSKNPSNSPTRIPSNKPSFKSSSTVP
mmetsp:Transcript_32202/g.46463  ORF Transcript_32202/g.46463 Transcript_32202/m.46463 type:complete len:1011 (+) Transcript_32202:567-3599(+)